MIDLISISEKIVKISKSHVCFGCAREISPGELMEKNTHREDGKILHTYFCAVCVAYLDRYPFNSYEEFCEGVLIQDKDWHTVEPAALERPPRKQRGSV